MTWANFLKPDEAPPPWANTVAFSRTTDRGATLSSPVLVDQAAPLAIDQAPRTSAVGPDGSVYVAFEDSRSPTSRAIGVLSSRDGGMTWSSTSLPDVSAFAFEPAIAVDRPGTVGVIWYDLGNDRPGDADVWFTSSEDHGINWRQMYVVGPTDLRTAAPPEPNRFGEYQGLAGMRTGFAAIFGLASPQAIDGPTDIFFARIGPGPGTARR